ncbi:MAG: MotA/TolQ/ExbB proton channel family protein [Lentisphaerae bacterium]|nr:MotA/TolQ/ExbB proton channel family protein [Lentisphaerota bacterium]
MIAPRTMPGWRWAILPALMATAGLAADGRPPAPVAPVPQALARTQQDIRQATAELNAARDAAAASRAPLVQRLNGLEADVRDLRRDVERRDALRQKEERDRNDQAAAAHALETEAYRTLAALHGYRQSLESRLGPAVPAALRGQLQALDPGLSAAQDYAGLSDAGTRLLDLAAQWNRSRLGGHAFNGACLDAGGRELTGRFVAIGPLTYFAADAGGAAGTVGMPPHGAAPALQQTYEGDAAAALATLAAGGEATVMLDTRQSEPARRTGLLTTLIAIMRGRGTPQDFMLLDMLRQGWPVLSILLLASIWSCAIILERALILRRAHLDASRFVDAVLKDLAEGGMPQALLHCQRHRKPVAAVVADVLTQPGGREDKERAMRHAIQVQIHNMEHRVPILGTIGSTAPFVGLLGTVAGIIRAFRDIAANAGGGASVVSAGIAEALVTTAFGLLVAIPAVMFYNHFVNSLRRFTAEMEMNVYHVIEKLCAEPPP